VGDWVDVKTWKRREHYRLFLKYRQPFFSVTVEVDVTNIWNRSRVEGEPSFFLVSVFHMLNAVNSVEPFRLRLRPRGVWRHDRVGVGPTIRRGDGTFGFARLDPAGSLGEFARLGHDAIAEAMSAAALEPANNGDDVVYHSVLPWFRFSGYTNALPGNDSIPRIVFGQAVHEGTRVKMPVAVEVHHALVDGADVGEFFERFNAELQRVPERSRGTKRQPKKR